MAKLFAEIVESLADCAAIADDGSDVYIPARSLFAMPVIEKDGQRCHGNSVDLRTLAVLKKGQAIPHGPVLRVVEVQERRFVCCNCGCSEAAKVLGFTGDEVVKFVREALARENLQQRHNRLHKENSDKAAKLCRQEEELCKLREEIDRLNHQLKNVSEEREKLAGQVESFKVGSPSLNSLRAEIDRLQAELASLRIIGRPLFSHRQKIAALENRVKELETSEAEEIKRLRDLFHDVSSRSPFYSDESPVALVDLAKKQGETHAAIIVKGEISSEAKIEFTVEHANVGIAAGKVFAKLIRENWALRNRVEQKTKENAALICTKAACVKTLEDRHTEALRENEKLEKRAKESEAVAQGLADDVQKLNKKITELVSARSGSLQAIVSITPLQSPLGDVVKFHSVKSPKASDFYVTTREPVFAPGALVGDSKVIEICNLVTGEVKEAKVLELEIVYSGKFDYSEVPPSKLMAYLSAFSRPFVAELMAKASRYDKVEAIVAPMVKFLYQDLKGLSDEGSGKAFTGCGEAGGIGFGAGGDRQEPGADDRRDSGQG